MSRFFGIASSVDWRSVTPVEKGWSADRKFRVVTEDGRPLLLRLSDAGLRDEKEKEYGIIEKYAQTGINLSAPLEFGVCEDGKSVYMLLNWVEGRDLEEVLPELTEGEQYALGREAGEDEFAMMEELHRLTGVPVPAGLAGLREKEVRHGDVIDKEDMLDYVLQFVRG